MDDTKKLIEKYKRELMELSKQKKPPQIIGYVDGDKTLLSSLQADLAGGSGTEKSTNPGNFSGVIFEEPGSQKAENSTVSAAQNSGKITDPRDDLDVIFEEPGSRKAENPAVSEAQNSGKISDPRDDFDVIFEDPGSVNNDRDNGDQRELSDNSGSGNSAAPTGNNTEIIDEYEPESSQNNAANSGMRPPKCNSEDPEGFGEPDVIFERSNSGNSANSSEKITEIIDEYEPGSTQNNAGKVTEINDENNSGASRNNAPNYTKISSTEQVREDITEGSKPQNNVIEKNVSGVTNNSANTPKADSTDAIRTTEEQAERLNDQPVSGTDPNEQLTGRSFEGADPLPDVDVSMEQGSRAEPINYPETNFTNFEEFERVNTGRGSLVFKVYTGREAVVIEGAECVITKKIGSEVRTIARLVTDQSGQTPVQELPAPPKELSQHSENTIQPFALYDAQVTKPGFVRVVLKDIPVFDGIQSVQRVFMIVE